MTTLDPRRSSPPERASRSGTLEHALAPPSDAREQQARRYQRQKRLTGLADWILGVAVLVVLLVTTATHALRDLALAVNSSPIQALAVYFLLFATGFALLDFPLDFYRRHWLEQKFNLSNQTVWGWLKDWLKALGLRLVLGLAAVELIYATLRRFPEWWWLLSAAAFVFFFLLLTSLAPVLLFPLFFKFEPFQDEALRQRLLELSRRVGARVRGVWRWKLSEKSKKANAALVGWGRTRRIVLADTLLEKHNPDEIEVILAHELAHHVHHDIGKGLVLQTVLTVVGFYSVDRVLEFASDPLGFAGISDFANLPLLLLVSAALSLLVLPAANSYSRHLERRADAFALRLTRNPEAFISAMEKLAEQNLAQRQPHPWMERIFHSHPSLEKRIALARSQQW